MNITDNFKTYSQNDEMLINPSYTTNDNIWNNKNSLLRSCHIDYSNRIISLGFPKFFNLGQCPESEISVTLNDLLKIKSEIVATLKLDGSLFIRFVQNNEVKFRTRGCLSIGLEILKKELPRLLEKYPKLLDPSFYKDDSILFEYISPENQIVIKYNNRDLILIGGIKYDKNVSFYKARPKLFNINEMITASQILCIPSVPYFIVKDIENFIYKETQREDIEGYVLRFNDAQKLVKIKTKKYILLHSIKSEMSVGKMIDLWLLWKQPNYIEFKNKFIESFDWECWSFVLPMASCIFDSIKIYKKIIDHINMFVNKYKELDRKDFAEKCKQAYDNNKLPICFSTLDNKPISDSLTKKIVIQNLKKK